MSWSCVSWDEVKDMTAILLAALAAVGLFTLLWLGLGRLLIPTHSVHLLLPVKGDGGDLEHNLKGQLVCWMLRSTCWMQVCPMPDGSE